MGGNWHSDGVVECVVVVVAARHVPRCPHAKRLCSGPGDPTEWLLAHVAHPPPVAHRKRRLLPTPWLCTRRIAASSPLHVTA